MRPKARILLEECIERGVRRGYTRAHKHNETPSEATIYEEIENCIMSEIYEYFQFDDL
jgi:hypothetical protein